MTHVPTRAVAVAVAGLGAALAMAAPAWAHGGDAPDGTNYRTVVTDDGTLPGVTVRAVEAGARLELANSGGETVEVLGYDGEPYLDVRPDGVFENVNSPATYLNVSLRGGEVPTSADPSAAPTWRRVSDEPVARWHDHRSHWMTSTPPPQVAADPQRRHRIRDWVVPLRAGVTTVDVRGTLDWVPPPSAALWWVAVVLAAGAVGALGLIPLARSGGAAALAVLAVVGGLTAIGYAVARELDAGSTSLGAVLFGLLVGQVWPVLAGLGAVGAGGYALARRPSADFALALAGACLALFAGLPNTAAFGRGVAPVPFAPTLARFLVAAVFAAGAGLLLANALRLRAAVRTAPTAPDPR
jgi:hypothetical protein